LRFEVLTLFPEAFPGPLSAGVVGKALQEGAQVQLHVHNLRDWAGDRHRQVDDIPYGGGAGMVLKPEPVFKAVRELKDKTGGVCVLLTPQGRVLDQELARELAQFDSLILVAGRYEGFDERIRSVVEYEVSIGDYVLSGGELASMVLIEVVARLVPGVLGDEESAANDTFSRGLLEYPQYTRPADFEGSKVPEVLLSGNHEEIRRWREQAALERTRSRRPDLYARLAPAGEPALMSERPLNKES
jgi:tRNA (guanine37-N1)-methyltransferase